MDDEVKRSWRARFRHWTAPLKTAWLKGWRRGRHRGWRKSSIRALRATSIVAGGFIALSIVAVTGASAPLVEPAAADQESLSESFMALLRGDGDALEGSPRSLPPWFEEEFFPLDDYFELCSNDDQTVISLSNDKPASSVMATIVSVMEMKGWTKMPSGLTSMVTMVKKEGLHTWALITCRSMGGQSSIVIQTLPAK